MFPVLLGSMMPHRESTEIDDEGKRPLHTSSKLSLFLLARVILSSISSFGLLATHFTLLKWDINKCACY